MALINLQTNKPKLNVSNINSPFGSGASIPNISAGAGSFINRPSTGIKPGKVLNIDEGQLSFNVGLADDIANLRKDIAVNRSNIGDHEKRISMLSGGVSTLNEELSEITAVIKDIGGALALDFANRITEQQQDNRALRARTSANRRSLAESSLEGVKKIGKGIGSGITGLASKTGSALGLGKILEAGKLLAAGVAINAIWPTLTKIFDWSTENLDKILLVGGGLLGIGVVAAMGSLVAGLGFLLNPVTLTVLGLIAGSAGVVSLINNAKNAEPKQDNVIIDGKNTDFIHKQTKWNFGDFMKEYLLGIPPGEQVPKMHDGGIVTGTTQEVPAILERGEAVLTKEQIALISKKPGINLINFSKTRNKFD